MKSEDQRQFYYKHMLDLQEKCKKSEEERMKLEEKYKQLIEESKIRHEACINRLRLRYIKFLEEQRARDERNNKLLGALDKVDSNLALIATKTERLNNLKKQYELYISQALDEEHERNTFTLGDSGVVSQNDPRSRISIHQSTPKTYKIKTENEGLRKSSPLLTSSSSLYNKIDEPTWSINSLRRRPSSSVVSPSKSLYYSPIILPQSSRVPSLRSNYLPQCYAKTMHEPNAIPDVSLSYLPRVYPSTGYSTGYRSNVYNNSGYPHYSSYGSPRRNTYSTENSPRDYKTSDLSAILERSANILSNDDRPLYTSTYKTLASVPNSSDLNPDLPTFQYKPIESLENKLEKYIQKIQNLHIQNVNEAEPPAADDEHNTSGDVLNESLSDDGIPTCDKTDIASKSETDENTGAKVTEDKSEQPNRDDEADTTGVADKFATLTNVPVSDTSAECVAPVIDENKTTTSAIEIEENPNAEVTENVEEVKQESSAILEEQNVEQISPAKDISEDKSEDEEQVQDNQEDKKELENEVGEENVTKEADQTGYDYPNQYEVDYNSSQVQEYPADQSYEQNADGSYYQDYQQEGQNYDQNYEQYQYEQNAGENYDTNQQYSESQEYAKESSDQQYNYDYGDGNEGQQYGENEKYEKSNYPEDEVNQYQNQYHEESADANGDYGRSDYVEQGYANAEPELPQNDGSSESAVKKQDNSESESTIERNTSNTASDFDFN